jgi:hypothetical protein
MKKLKRIKSEIPMQYRWARAEQLAKEIWPIFDETTYCTEKMIKSTETYKQHVFKSK